MQLFKTLNIFFMPFGQKSVLVCYVVFSKLISSQHIQQGNADEAAWVEEGDWLKGLSSIQRSTGRLVFGRCTKETQLGGERARMFSNGIQNLKLLGNNAMVLSVLINHSRAIPCTKWSRMHPHGDALVIKLFSLSFNPTFLYSVLWCKG